MARRRAPARSAPAALLAVAVSSFAFAWAGEALALDATKDLSQYVARSWKQSEDGLPQNLAAAIAQTPDGYLWIGTQEGLARFDGVAFTIFGERTTPALPSDDVKALLVDRDGVLWVGTRGGGLAQWSGSAFTTVDVGGEHVQSLFADRDGRLWVSTRTGLAKIDHGKLTTFHVKDGLANDAVYAVAEDKDGVLWIGTDDGLSRYDGTTFKTFRAADGLPNATVLSVYVDRRGTLWVGTKGGGLATRDGDRFRQALPGKGLDTEAVAAIFEDHDGNLWIGTQGAGIARVQNDAVSFLKQKGGDHFDTVRTFFEDREKNVWVGLESAGLLRLSDGKMTTYSTEQGLPNEQVWSIKGGGANDLWIGTARGLAHYSSGPSDPSGAMTTFTSKEGIANASILALDRSSAGGVWLGTDGTGIGYLDGTTVHHFDHKSGLPGDTVWSLLEDSEGTLWIGLFPSGLVRIEKAGAAIAKDALASQPTTTYGAKDGLPDNAILTMAEGPDHALWLGTAGGGVARWKDSKFTVYAKKKDGLSSDTVESVYPDADGSVWIGTSGGGIDRLKDGKLTSVNSRDGLYDDTVLQIIDDGAGDFWMTCNKGIFRAKKSELAEVMERKRERVACTSFGVIECNGGSPGGWRTTDGRLWFATVQGVAMIDPAKIPRNDVPPPVHVTRVDVDRAAIDLGKTTTLAPDSRDFTFAYTAPSFTAADKVRFKYMLEGFDHDFIDAGARRVAYYTNLAPGPYRFRVLAENEDGVWNTEGASVTFVLAPHFWQTWPFYALCAVAGVLSIAGIVSWRVRVFRDKARELEEKVAERTVQLAKANGDLSKAFTSLAEKDSLLREDLEQAKAFQERILPRLPKAGALRFGAIYRPADLVGGDIYDVCEIGGGRYRVFLADTTGHGVQASLRTMVLKTEYDVVKLLGGGPSRALTELNRKITTVYPGLEMRCSACCFDVTPMDDGSAVVRYANAAHPPLLQASAGKVSEVEGGGTFLGMVEEATFGELEVRLKPGDLLLAYTDGIYEQEDESGKAFGVERMQAILAMKRLDAESAVRAMGGAVDQFRKGRAAMDDMLMVCIECVGARAGTAKEVHA